MHTCTHATTCTTYAPQGWDDFFPFFFFWAIRDGAMGIGSWFPNLGSHAQSVLLTVSFLIGKYGRHKLHSLLPSLACGSESLKHRTSLRQLGPLSRSQEQRLMEYVNNKDRCVTQFSSLSIVGTGGTCRAGLRSITVLVPDGPTTSRALRLGIFDFMPR